MMRKFFIIFFCVANMGFVSRAQIPIEPTREFNDSVDSVRIMTLHDCMEYAISNSTKMRIQQAEIGDAQIERRDAALKLFTPQINSQTYAYYNFGRSIDPQTNTYFNTTSFHNNYGISAGYELFDGFKAVNNYKISKTGMMIAQSQQKQVEADICLAVMEAYYNVVYYKRLCNVYEEQISAAEKALHKARRQEELGQKGHADVVQMEAELAERQYELTNTYNFYRDQKIILADLMFWPLDMELKIDISLPESLGKAECREESASEESVIDFALQHNPALQIADGMQQNAKRELNTAKWQVLPTIGLHAGWSTSYYSYKGAATEPFRRQFKNNAGEFVEVSLTIPIWNRLGRHSTISRKRNALTRASAEYQQKRREVESEIRRAIQERDLAAVAYTSAKRKAEVQNEAYALNVKKLEQGLISPLEFQTANSNYLKAQADRMNSLLKYLIRQAVVKYYNGVEYINQ